ncbi:YybH family protein [Ekhidna sp.]
MVKYTPIITFFSIILSGCSNQETNNIDQWKSEIIQVEKDFNDMAQEKGLIEAFHHFAAVDGVIKRNRKIVKGKIAIRDWYKEDVRPNETLTWKPTFVDVSSSGDLAYTYGNYVFSSTDSTGIKKESKGIFHTVWKRQEDGNWRFVWD